MTTDASVTETVDSSQPDSSGPAPSVTCVIIAYNHARFVEEALDSAFAQTYPNLRIIVFDDASTDGTPDVIREYLARTGHDDVLFVAHEENRGLCPTLNEAVDLVDSDYVAFISADDTQEPHRFEAQVGRMEQLGAEYGLCYSDANRITVDSDVTGARYLDGKEHYEGSVFLQMLMKFFITPPSILLRRSVFDTVGGYDEEFTSEDYDMSLRVARHFKVGLVRQPLVNYRITPGSMWEGIQADRLGFILEVRSILLKQFGSGTAADLIIRDQVAALAKSGYLYGYAPREVQRDIRFASRFPRQATAILYMIVTTARIPGPTFRGAVRMVRRLKQSGRLNCTQLQ